LPFRNDGLFHVSNRGTTQHISWATLGRQDFATALAADPVRGLWIGFQDGGVAYFDDGQVRASYTAAAGLGEARVSSLRFDREGALWAATQGGLSRIRNGRVATLTMRNGLPCDAVHWTINDDADAVWLYMSCGLVRIPGLRVDCMAGGVDNDLDRAQTVRNTLFDKLRWRDESGCSVWLQSPGGEVCGRSHWFLSLDGLAAVDPQRLPFNRLPPPVFIEQVTANRTTHDVPGDDAAGVRLPPLIRGPADRLHGAQPGRAREDAVSLQAGRARQRLCRMSARAGRPSTTDLSPGRYRFRVIASNNSGVWTRRAPRSTSRSRQPTTNGLVSGIGAGFVVVFVWTAHRVRLRIVEKHEREISALNERLMKAQEQERIRIAGELHDGVMQQMLAGHDDAGHDEAPDSDELDAKAAIDKIQDKLIQAGTDIRQLSHGSTADAPGRGLPRRCAAIATSSAPVAACRFLRCREDARDVVAGRGARPVSHRPGSAGERGETRQRQAITVRLTRSNGMVSLTVSDDGIGFDRSGWPPLVGLGLITMRERAGQLNGPSSSRARRAAARRSLS
jgi:hypothetical protein